MPLEFEFMVMRLRRCERAVAGGDGVVAAGLDAHVVRRIGVHQVNHCPVEQSVEVFGLGRIPAEKAMFAQNPQVPGLRRGRIGRGWDLVGVDEPFGEILPHDLCEFVGRETE